MWRYKHRAPERVPTGSGGTLRPFGQQSAEPNRRRSVPRGSGHSVPNQGQRRDLPAKSDCSRSSASSITIVNQQEIACSRRRRDGRALGRHPETAPGSLNEAERHCPWSCLVRYRTMAGRVARTARRRRSEWAEMLRTSLSLRRAETRGSRLQPHAYDAARSDLQLTASVNKRGGSFAGSVPGASV